MTIKNFSKDLLLVATGYDEFQELDTKIQNQGLEIISKVINRLTGLGFTDYKLVGDDSLSIEVHDELMERGLTPTVYNMYPSAAREFLLGNIISSNRNKLVYGHTTLEGYGRRTQSKLMETELELGYILKNEIKVTEGISLQQKLNVIKKVIALKTLGIKVNEKNVHKHESEYIIFLHNLGKTELELEEMIKEDLDYRWEWAKGEMYRGATNQSMHLDAGEKEDYDPEHVRLMNILELIKSETEVTSNFTFDVNLGNFNKMQEQSKEQTKALRQIETVVPTNITLTDGMKTLTKKEFVSSDHLVTELSSVITKIDTYTDLVYRQLISDSNLIFDFYVSKTSRRTKRLPYDNIKDNKMLISIDLKNGNVEAYFKGKAFKLNPFFNKGEEVKTNAMEW